MAVMTPSNLQGATEDEKAMFAEATNNGHMDTEMNGTTSTHNHASNDTSSDALNATDIQSPTTALASMTRLEVNDAIATVASSTQETTISSAINDASDPTKSAELTSATLFENIPASSTVPRAIDAPESDVRHDNAVPPTEQLHLEVNGPSQPVVAMEPNPTAPITPAESITSMGDIVGDISVDVAPQPSATTPLSDAPKVDDTKADVEMSDWTAEPSTKVSREREEDVEEPSAKRTKTEDDDQVMTSADASKASMNGDSNGDPNGDSGAAKIDMTIPITQFQIRELSKVLRNVLRTNAGRDFRAPVTQLWPQLSEQYEAKVSNPIDLGTVEKKLKANEYANMLGFEADVRLLYDNCVIFNGPEHVVTKHAQDARDTLVNRASTIPPEAPVVAKPARFQKRATPTGESAPKRGLRTPAAPPAQPSTTFALDPSTSTPLIRRDSTKVEGGRPKREIHPPKNKDLIYAVPKSKKFATELRFCEEVLSELKKARHSGFSHPFQEPVDPVALNIPGYYTIIKTPMDLATISERLRTGAYPRAKDFESDVRLIFSNCYKFNPVGNVVRAMGKQLEDLFDAQWAKKDKWISDHTPAAPPSASSAVESEEEESEEEEEPAAPATSTSAAALRLIDEQKKLIALMTAKKQDPMEIELQQQVVDFVQKRVNEESTAPAKRTKKPKAAKPKKPVAKKEAKGGKKAAPRTKYMGLIEKEVISAGIQTLPEPHSTEMVELIRIDQGLAPDNLDLELDIDQVSHDVLCQIYDIIMREAPEIEDEIRETMRQREREQARAMAKPAPKRKNKPMNSTTQERNIERLRESMQAFERHASTSNSQEPLPTVEPEEDTSGDESSDSEEE